MMDLRFSLNSAGRYYHSRTPKHTDPAQAAASAASAQPRLQSSPGSGEEDAAGPSGLSSLPQSPADLPSFMGGVHVFFYNLPASERKKLARYLITYPFS